MWFLPSRGRPENVKRFFQAYEEMESSTPGVLWLDEDDANNYSDVEIPDGWDKLVMPRYGGTGIMTNKFYELYPCEPWYGLLGDDVVPRTKNWDTKLVEAAGISGLSYANDLLRGEKHASHPVVGGLLARKLGWLALPGCDRTYIDDALMYAAKIEGKCYYLKDVILEHLHFSVGKSEFDGTYEKLHGDTDRKIYEAWVASYQTPVTFVCVSWGNYCGRGAEYVNVLFDSVCRNLQAGFPGKFVCFTDSPEGLNPAIEVRELPGNLGGWWNKLYLFKKDLFLNGERIIFLDLDTVIVSDIDDIVQYRGDFATLRDFYDPTRFGPAIMAWRANHLTEIWDSYEKSGCPVDLPLGDLSWINKTFTEMQYTPDILQDLYPGKICSFKKDAKFTVPSKASIVCFHGEPRPHEAGGWVENVWKIGGAIKGLGNFHCNVEDSILRENIISNTENYGGFVIESAAEDNGKTAIVVGGAPSVQNNLEFIRELSKQENAVVFGLNNAAKYLYNNNIKVDFGVLVDARDSNIEFYKSVKNWEWGWLPFEMLIASWVSPKLIKEINEFRLFHIASDVHIDVVKEGLFIGGGRTVGLISLALLTALGYRTIHIFGYDSSFTDGKHHAYPQPGNDQDTVIEVQYNGRTFTTTPWMAKQAEDFIELSNALIEKGVTLIVHGEGLLPYIAECLSNQPEENNV